MTEYEKFVLHDQEATLKHLRAYKKICSGWKGKRVIDVGCGTGILSSILVEKNEVHGIDAEIEAVTAAQKKGIKAVQFQLSERFPYPDNFFDAGICKDVFEHLMEPEKTLVEIKRVLKPQGQLLAHVPNEFNFIDRIQLLLGKDLVKQRWFENAESWNYPHVRFFTKTTFRKFLIKYGFEIEKDYSQEWSFGNFKFLGKIRSELFSPGITFLCKNYK